jgi:ATP-dependent DNA helicase RecQ
VRALQEVGVGAGALTSGNTPEETDAVWEGLEAGTLKLLYMAPERLAAGSVQGMLKRVGVQMIAVDEAHCVSQWGHDFRPDYLRIGELRRALDVPLAAFTATADAETRTEIIQKLFDGAAPSAFLHGFDRPNIHLAFAAKNKPRDQILNFASARKGQSGIVYCGTRAKTEGIARALREAGQKAIHYHGGMEAEDRRIAERQFQQEDGLIVCATVAFGMGVDKPDIRWVAHADLPKSIEAYYQEIGRAGRDGAPAKTLTLFGSDDIRLRRSQIDEGLAPPERRAADHGRLNALLGLAEALECRRKNLLGYFEEAEITCGNCDLCDTPADVFDGTTAVRKALSAILRTEEWFGAGHLIDILLGVETDKVKARGHASLPTFGVGGEYGRPQWQAVFRQMMGHDLIRPDPERHGALRMTDAALPILRDEAKISLRRDTIKAAGATRRPAVKQMVNEEDAPLLSALKAKRRALAEAAKVPAYIIFTDRSLIEMAETRPGDLDGMARIGGVGAKKLETFGRAFLDVINGTSEGMHPTRRKLAGREAGDVYDRLLQAQADLARGSAGTDKPLSCSASLLAKVAQLRQTDDTAFVRILGERRAERFGPAFRVVLENR